MVHGTSNYRTGRKLQDLKPEVAAKSGTADTFHGTTPTTTLSAISYAPYNDPQVVVAVAFPGLSSESAINMNVVHQIYEEYWKMVQSSDSYK